MPELNMPDLAASTLDRAAAHYGQFGYAVFPALFDRASLAPLAAAARRIIEGFDPTQHRSVFSTRDGDRGRDAYFMASAEAVHCFLEEHAVDPGGELVLARDKAVNKIGHALHDHVPEFQALARHPVITRILGALGYQEPQLWQSMYIFKQPRIGGEVRWHQDATYLHSSPSSVIGFWLAIENADRGNGCLWLKPGGQNDPLRERYERAADGSARLRTIDDLPWPTEDEAVAVEAPAGSLVVFHDHVPHYSSENHSARSRQAYTMHFMDGRSEWPASNWLQRPHLGPFVL
jgi:phytanoyl-CoA hydroxylase